jgi:hypothetical protein
MACQEKRNRGWFSPCTMLPLWRTLTADPVRTLRADQRDRTKPGAERDRWRVSVRGPAADTVPLPFPVLLFGRSLFQVGVRRHAWVGRIPF